MSYIADNLGNYNHNSAKAKLIPNYDTVNYPHFLIPSLNCSLDANETSNYVHEYMPLSYKFSLPVPMGAPAELTGKAIRGIDHVTELVNDKAVWQINKNEFIVRNLKTSGVSVVKTQHKNIKRIQCELLKLAEHLDSDPDPKFFGTYNWYFSGGCLSNIFHNDMYSIVYTNNSAPGMCVVAPFSTNNNCTASSGDTALVKTGNKHHIFQIDVNNSFFAARQRNFTTLFSITKGRKLKFKKIHQNSETMDGIVSVSICDGSEGKYCSLTTSRKLKLWSPEVKDDCINCVEIKSSIEDSDLWGSVKYVSNSNLLVSTRSSVFLKDTRMRIEKNVQKWKTNIGKVPCDYISLIMKSKTEDHSYIGTTHYLYKLDFRKGLSKQWTHMLEQPPMYGNVNPLYNGSETVFIASQNLNEICAIESNLQVMPYILPSPEETRYKVNLQGLCLDPTVSSRFHFSMIGMTCVPDTNKHSNAFVLRSTSVGDMFYQSVIPNDDEDECINFKSFLKWEKNSYKLFKTMKHAPLTVTDTIDFDKFFNQNDSKGLEKIKKRYKKEMKKKRKRSDDDDEDEVPKLIPKSELLDANDDIAINLSKIWNFENLDGCIKEDKTEENTVIKKSLSPVYSNTFDKDYYQNISLCPVPEDRKPVLDNTIFSPKQFSLHVENSSTPYRNVASCSSDLGNNSNILNYEQYNQVDPVECNNQVTLNVGQKKKVVRTKTKSRFSSGF